MSVIILQGVWNRVSWPLQPWVRYKYEANLYFNHYRQLSSRWGQEEAKTLVLGFVVGINCVDEMKKEHHCRDFNLGQNQIHVETTKVYLSMSTNLSVSILFMWMS
jgi:hypothetical protein